VQAVSGIVQRSPAWAMRVQAAEALGRVGPRAGSAAFTALAGAALRDPYALVREAALEAAGKVDREAAVPMWRAASENDPETRLRSLAKERLARDARP
jgi:HEAT repeat protein